MTSVYEETQRPLFSIRKWSSQSYQFFLVTSSSTWLLWLRVLSDPLPSAQVVFCFACQLKFLHRRWLTSFAIFVSLQFSNLSKRSIWGRFLSLVWLAISNSLASTWWISDFLCAGTALPEVWNLNQSALKKTSSPDGEVFDAVYIFSATISVASPVDSGLDEGLHETADEFGGTYDAVAGRVHAAGRDDDDSDDSNPLIDLAMSAVAEATDSPGDLLPVATSAEGTTCDYCRGCYGWD